MTNFIGSEIWKKDINYYVFRKIIQNREHSNIKISSTSWHVNFQLRQPKKKITKETTVPIVKKVRTIRRFSKDKLQLKLLQETVYKT
jgi:hypothetical protein